MKNMRLSIHVFYLAVSVILFAGSGCEKETDQEKEEADILAYIEENNITEEAKYSGLYYIETKKGTGAPADGGDNVKVRYKGTFLDGEEFDSGEFSFRLGIGQVIPGWDEGISYMKEGGKAILLIPSVLGYGSFGSGKIPEYTPLLFEVELLNVY
jgi:FKBP-type peptidyl-prolyl cis-trans isomerase FkpA